MHSFTHYLHGSVRWINFGANASRFAWFCPSQVPFHVTESEKTPQFPHFAALYPLQRFIPLLNVMYCWQVRGQMAQLAGAQRQQQEAAMAHTSFQAAVATPLPPLPSSFREMGHEVVSAQATAKYAQALQVALYPPPQSPFLHSMSFLHSMLSRGTEAMRS